MPTTITWRQIRDETVTTNDIQNNTILREDLSEEVKNAIDSWGWWTVSIDFSFTVIKDWKVVYIPDDQQMNVHSVDEFIIDWVLQLDWDLLLIDN